jgi:hypothetical protein
MPGLSCSAIARIFTASSEVHIDAEKRTLGWYCFTVVATSSIANHAISGLAWTREGVFTGAIRDVFDIVAALKRFDHTTYKARCAFWCGIDSDEAEGAFPLLCHDVRTKLDSNNYEQPLRVLILLNCSILCARRRFDAFYGRDVIRASTYPCLLR